MCLAINYLLTDVTCSFNTLIGVSRGSDSTDSARTAAWFYGKLIFQLDRPSSAQSVRSIGAAFAISTDRDSENVKVLYQLHSIRLKVAMLFLREPTRGFLEAALVEGLRWMFAVEDPPVEYDYSLENKAWVVVVDAVAGLRRCREIEPHDAKSVYRLSQFILQGAQLSTVPQWARQRLQSLGIEELSAVAAANEMGRLFDTRLPQVVAIWALEEANSSYDRVLQRTAKFDSLLRKYFGFYVSLLILTDDLPRLQQLIGCVVSSKKRGVVMDLMVDALVPGVLEVVRNMSGERSPLECLQTLYQVSEGFKQRKHLPSFAALLRGMSECLSAHLGEDVGYNSQTVTAFCSKTWGAQKKVQRLPSMIADGEIELPPMQSEPSGASLEA